MTENILGPSVVNVQKPAPLYSGFTPGDIIPNGCVRVLQNISITGSGAVYITDDRSAIGVPLFTNITLASASVIGDPGVILNSTVVVDSNSQITVYVYDQSGLYGASVDVQLLIIGESAV